VTSLSELLVFAVAGAAWKYPPSLLLLLVPLLAPPPSLLAPPPPLLTRRLSPHHDGRSSGDDGLVLLPLPLLLLAPPTSVTEMVVVRGLLGLSPHHVGRCSGSDPLCASCALCARVRETFVGKKEGDKSEPEPSTRSWTQANSHRQDATTKDSDVESAMKTRNCEGRFVESIGQN
jgi:hypothetical protein